MMLLTVNLSHLASAMYQLQTKFYMHSLSVVFMIIQFVSKFYSWISMHLMKSQKRQLP
jgi:hypothetical protein